VSWGKLLGFAESDIQVLMAVGKLTPLGDPAPNAPKWFAAVEMIRLAADQDWLHKATKEISKYWRNKRERRQTPEPLLRRSEAKTDDGWQ
jgi:DMSO/TMAO reductase YedYZ molybdopterin-dependent catalytic subunit